MIARKTTGFVLLIAMAVFIGTYAETVETLTLEQAIAEAYASNPMLKSAGEAAAGAAARVEEAKSGLGPRFTLSETMTSTNSPVWSFMSELNQQGFAPAMMNNINDPETTTNFNTRLGIVQPIYTGGMVSAGIRAARHGSEAAVLGVERTRQMVRFNTKTSYLQIIIAQKQLGVADKALETANAHAKITKDMLDNGMIVESDHLSAMVRVAEIEEMRLVAENNLQLAKAGLLMAMGAGQDRDFEVEPSALEQVEFDGDFEQYLEDALTNRQDLKALGEAVGARENSATVAKAERRPGVFLMGNTDLDNSSFIDNDGESWFVGLSVNYNLFDSGQARGRVRRAVAKVNETKWQREQMRQGIELEVRQAFLSVQTAEKQIEVMQKAVEHAHESYKIVNNRYNNGLAINVEVLAAEAARTEAETRYLFALFQYVIGVERLKLATGIN